MCKVYIAKDIAWAQAGILFTSDSSFSIENIARTSMQSGTMRDRISRFKYNVDKPLISVLELLRANDADYYAAHIEGQGALQIVFAAFEKGILALYSLNFVPHSNDATGTISLDLTEKISPSTEFPSNMVVTMGRHEAADEEVARHPDIWTTMGVPSAVRSLIQTEVAAVPAEVGPPISILAIERSGSRWVSKGQCGE